MAVVAFKAFWINRFVNGETEMSLTTDADDITDEHEEPPLLYTDDAKLGASPAIDVSSSSSSDFRCTSSCCSSPAQRRYAEVVLGDSQGTSADESMLGRVCGWCDPLLCWQRCYLATVGVRVVVGLACLLIAYPVSLDIIVSRQRLDISSKKSLDKLVEDENS